MWNRRKTRHIFLFISTFLSDVAGIPSLEAFTWLACTLSHIHILVNTSLRWKIRRNAKYLCSLVIVSPSTWQEFSHDLQLSTLFSIDDSDLQNNSISLVEKRWPVSSSCQLVIFFRFSKNSFTCFIWQTPPGTRLPIRHFSIDYILLFLFYSLPLTILFVLLPHLSINYISLSRKKENRQLLMSSDSSLQMKHVFLQGL